MNGDAQESGTTWMPISNSILESVTEFLASYRPFSYLMMPFQL